MYELSEGHGYIILYTLNSPVTYLPSHYGS